MTQNEAAAGASSAAAPGRRNREPRRRTRQTARNTQNAIPSPLVPEQSAAEITSRSATDAVGRSR